ncbi:MAG: tetratricopeptide repeat protein [Candidatus Obscuribacterales bacterium]
MTLVITASGLLPIAICHLIVAGVNGFNPLDLLWYIPLLPILFLINWFLTGALLGPLRNLIGSTNRLAAMDIRQRLEVDASEQQEMLELRRAFNKLLNRLEESLNIQCQFVADASHELRTPLTSIQGYTKLLQRRRGEIDQQLLSEALQTISDESGRLIRLVSDLLALARADAGQAIIAQQEIIDLRDVLQSVEDTVTVIAPEQVEIQFIIPQKPVWVSADADKLKQVFLNLTNNAIKATQSGGKVTVTLRSSNNQAIVRIIDTGIGIAPADQQRIFDRFYRVERSRTRSKLYGGGTGLGLAIALTIIRAHGGTIELESELNKGSTFTVRLPITEKEPREKPGRDPQAAAVGMFLLLALQMVPGVHAENVGSAKRKIQQGGIQHDVTTSGNEVAPEQSGTATPQQPALTHQQQQDLQKNTLQQKKFDATIEMGNKLYAAGKYQDSIKVYEKAVAIDPYDCVAHFNQAMALMELARYKEAIDHFNEAIRLEPKFFLPRFERGVAYMRSSEYERALNDFTIVKRLNPKHIDSQYYQGLALIGLKQNQAGIQALRGAAAADNKFPRRYLYQGMALSMLNRPKEAVKQFDIAVTKSKNPSEALAERGKLYAKAGNIEKATADFDALIKLSPGRPLPLVLRGIAAASAEQYVQACGYFDAAIDLSPDFHLAYYNRGLACMQAGDLAAALNDLEKAKEVNPNYQPTLQALEQVHSMMKAQQSN